MLLEASPEHGEVLPQIIPRYQVALVKPVIEQVQVLADVSRSGYVVIATQPVHRLQLRPTMHN